MHMANGHTNYSLKLGALKSLELDETQFLEAQLFEAKQLLFTATTVREIRFLQNKINYLRMQMTELQKKERGKVKNKNKKARGQAKKPKIVRYKKYQPRIMMA